MGDELFDVFGANNPDVILLRWLRARKWQVSSAVEFIMDTLRWRHEWGVRKLMEKGESELIVEECASGKTYHMGMDRSGRPVTYVHANEHIKGQFPLEATEKFIILNMELGRYLAEHHIEQGTVVLDMTNVTLKNLDYQYVKFTINIMQNNYPECLGIALVVNAPRGFDAVWRFIRRWIDPVVESKVHFIKNLKELTEYIDPAFIPRRLEGAHIDFQFIPPTKEDEARLTIFRKDKDGMEKAKLEHREAAQHYLNVTLKWANTHNEKNNNLERINATKQLSDAYKQLLPYISTQTHYHRTGAIQQPIFDITYHRICDGDSETVHF
jgi:hypothetical protein